MRQRKTTLALVLAPNRIQMYMIRQEALQTRGPRSTGAGGKDLKAAMKLAGTAKRHLDRLATTEEYLELRTTEWLLLRSRLHALGIPAPQSVLEIGSGCGYSLLHWATADDKTEVLGLDLEHEVQRAHIWADTLADKDLARRISFHTMTGEGIDDSVPDADLVITQYVLEHVDSIPEVLKRIKGCVRPGGYVVHVLNNLPDRNGWYLEYTGKTPWLKRIVHAFRAQGPKAMARRPHAFVPPHEPAFGTFWDEHREYRMERWAWRLFEAGYEIVDHFPTRDVNRVFITRPIREGTP